MKMFEAKSLILRSLDGSANVTYEVGEARWQKMLCSQNPSVTKMTNGLRTDFVRGEQSLAFVQVLSKRLLPGTVERH